MDCSPDTLPSLAVSEVSRTSTGHDDITRTLFQTPEKDEALQYILGKNQRLQSNDEFSMKDSIADSNGSHSTEGTRETLDTFEQLTFENLVEGFGGVQKTTDFTNACKSAMNIVPSGFFDIFGETDKKHNDESIVTSPAVTEVMGNLRSGSQNWKHKAESLERECSTLKHIINDDSHHILRLKTEIDQRKMHNMQSSLEKADGNMVLDLEQQCQLLRDRESKLLESIEATKSDLGRIATERAKDLKEAAKEIQRLKLENELFSYQIVALEEIEKENQGVLDENARLKDEIEDLRTENSMRCHRIGTKTASSPAATSSVQPLMAQVAALSAKLSEIEDDMEYRDQQRNDIIEENERFAAFGEEDTLPFVYSASDLSSASSHFLSELPIPRSNMLPVGITTQDEFEVTLDGLIISTSCSGETDLKKATGLVGDRKRRNDLKSTLCDCLEPTRQFIEA